jgi:hypothetical protein
MKTDILEVTTSWREDDQWYTCESVPLKLYSGVWTNHSLMPLLLQQMGEPGEDTEQADTRRAVAPVRKES